MSFHTADMAEKVMLSRYLIVSIISIFQIKFDPCLERTGTRNVHSNRDEKIKIHLSKVIKKIDDNLPAKGLLKQTIDLDELEVKSAVLVKEMKEIQKGIEIKNMAKIKMPGNFSSEMKSNTMTKNCDQAEQLNNISMMRKPNNLNMQLKNDEQTMNQDELNEKIKDDNQMKKPSDSHMEIMNIHKIMNQDSGHLDVKNNLSSQSASKQHSARKKMMKSVPEKV